MSTLCYVLLLATITVVHGTSVFVLVGGTGDLSSKYLWDAAFRKIFLQQPDTKIFTSGRSDATDGKAKLEKILKRLHCLPKDGPQCAEESQKFAQMIQYTKLENDPDYAKFCFELFNGKKGVENVTEVMWYLATPPTYYPIIQMSLHTSCRNPTSTLKVAMEKPFWKTNDDFAALSRILAGRFKPNELFFVDHYLAKPTTKILSSFKLQNSRWFKIRRLQKLELVLLERENIQDSRIRYYDSFGVVRDTIQSHLNELALIFLEDPDEDLFGNSRDEDDERDILRDILGRMRPFAQSDWVFGQHINYKNLTKGESKTPTFAGLKFKFDVAANSGDTVEKDVILVAGKYLNSKRSYARLLFADEKTPTQQIEAIFLFSAPVILLNAQDPNFRPIVPIGWHIDKSDKLCQKWINRITTETTCSDFQVLTLSTEIDETPYEMILREFVTSRDKRKSSIFTKWTVLEESWNLLWRDVLKNIEENLGQPIALVTYENAGEVLDLVFPNKDRLEIPKIEL